MCCFSAPTAVHGTTLFARLVRPGTQLLVYQMRYSAKTPTAMILPLPVALPAREDSVRFKSLKAYPELFAHLAAGFPEPPRRAVWGSKSVAASQAAPTLAVHDVGDFVATFIPSQRDFGRVDPRFALRPEVWAKLPAYRDYGFAVFQLKELAGTPHPIAFELDTRLDAALFLPTVHIHDGEVHDTGDFDHALYIQSAALDARTGDYEGPEVVDEKTGFVRSQGPARAFVETERADESRGLVDPELLVHRRTLQGTLPNRDTFVDLKKIAASPRGCSRCSTPGGSLGDAAVPLGLTMAGLGWVIDRRRRLRGTRT